jgi:catechol 2,3-dioxygenase-like lactoylglutathione lyase family enzyme
MQFSRFSTTLLTDAVAPTRDFYVERLGWRVTADAGFFVSLAHDEQAYELCVMQPEHPIVPEGHRAHAAGVILGFAVEDAEAEAERLQAAGVELVTAVIDEPYGQRHFFVTDPAGSLIDIVQMIDPDPEWLAAHGL